MASCLNYAPINVKPEGGMWVRGEDLTFSLKKCQTPLPRENMIGQILYYKTNEKYKKYHKFSTPVSKSPPLGRLCQSNPHPLAAPPPLGFNNIDRCINEAKNSTNQPVITKFQRTTYPGLLLLELKPLSYL